MDRLDRLTLSGMMFYARHGVHAEETALGQRFEVDVDMYADLSAAAAQDRLEDTIDYSAVYRVVQAAVTGERRYRLLEALAQAVAQRLLNDFALLEKVTVRVRKPHAPLNGIFNYVEAAVTRERSGPAAGRSSEAGSAGKASRFGEAGRAGRADRGV